MSGGADGGVTLRCEFCLSRARVRLDADPGPPSCPECGRPFLIDRPRKVREEDFDATVLGAGVPVLVDFYADWCGPCRWLEPYLEEVAREGAGRLLVAKVDTDRAPEVAARCRIASIPTVLVFRGGEEVDRSVGVEPGRVRAMARTEAGAAGPSTGPNGTGGVDGEA